MLVFSTTTRHRIDGQGRVSVPQVLRQILERRTGKKSFFLTVARERDRLVAYDADFIESMQQRFAERQLAGTATVKERVELEKLFGMGQQVDIDSAGRIPLRQDLREIAGITDECVFVGLGATFEIRAPAVHDRIRARVMEYIAPDEEEETL